jgi:hypothetical protein
MHQPPMQDAPQMRSRKRLPVGSNRIRARHKSLSLIRLDCTDSIRPVLRRTCRHQGAHPKQGCDKPKPNR